MVKILNNGDIVADDDPRLNKTAKTTSIPRDTPVNQLHQQQQANAGQHSNPLFEAANTKLKEFGLTTIEFSGYSIEPVAYVALGLMALTLGFRGILFFFVIYAVSQLSQGHSLASLLRPNASGTGGQSSTGRASSTSTSSNQQSRLLKSGQGHRLGGD